MNEILKAAPDTLRKYNVRSIEPTLTMVGILTGIVTCGGRGVVGTSLTSSVDDVFTGRIIKFTSGTTAYGTAYGLIDSITGSNTHGDLYFSDAHQYIEKGTTFSIL